MAVRSVAVGWLVATLSGCTIYDPYRVMRLSVDFNTERALSAQAECLDHLPPRIVRLRLMKWGYNVGPAALPPEVATTAPVPGNSTAPAAPPATDPMPLVPPPSPAAPPAEVDQDLLERSQPPVMPKVGAPQDESPLSPVGPTAQAPSALRPAGLQTPGGTRRSTATAAWLFAPP